MGKVRNFDVEGMSFHKLTTTGLVNGGSFPYFCIPAYQREYTWEAPQVIQLLGDVYDYFWEACQEDQFKEKDAGVAEKFIGAFILVERERDARRAKTVYDVIDGQQRITTISLTIAAGVNVLLGISYRIAELAKRSDGDPAFRERAEEANRKIVSQIKDVITVLYDASADDKYVPKLFRESDDMSAAEVFGDNHPKKCEILKTSDAEVEALYGSATARFFFYFAKARAILWNWKPKHQDYVDAFSTVIHGEKYLESSDKKTCYKRNYELARKFLWELSRGMKYEGTAEDLPFNKGLGDESQYDPKPVPEHVGNCVSQDSNLPGLIADLKPILAFQENENDDRLKELCTSALNVLTYLDFLSKSVSVAVISGNNDTALDLFETMNTAGQPLGSIETFIPDVYQMVAKLEKAGEVGKNEYLDKADTFGVLQNCSIRDIVSELQNVFGISKNRKGVPVVVIWFSLIGFGNKVGKNFTIQRSELKKSFRGFIGCDHGNFAFDGETTRKKIHEFVSLLSFIGRWWVYCYGDAPDLEESQDIPIPKRFEGNWAFVNGYLPEELLEEVGESELNVFNTCLLFLIRAGQSLSIAVIGRYYVQLLKDPSIANFRELVKAAKAIAAFTAVWLSGEIGSTQYAETQRRTMAHIVDPNKVMQTPGRLAYFWNMSCAPGESVTARQLQQSLISGYKAKNGSFSLKTWSDKLPFSELAVMRKEVNRFLLLLYWHCTTCQDCYKSFGIRKTSDKFEINFLTGESWNALSSLEIEHVVPRDPKKWKLDFDPKSTDGKRTLNEIGNTTLLPKKINVYASNKPWNQKRSIYRVFCARTIGQGVKILAELKDVSKSDRNTIKNQLVKLYGEFEKVDTFLVSSLQHVEEWNSSVIRTRTKAIAMIVWPLLSEWLGHPEKFDNEAFEALLAGKSASAPQGRRGRKPKKETAATPATGTENKTKNEDVHEALRPFLTVIPRSAWTEVVETKLTIDNASVYLSVFVEGDKTVVELGRREKGKPLRARGEKDLPESVEFKRIPGEDRNCVDEVFVYAGTGAEAEKALLDAVKKRKDRFVPKLS